MHPDELDLVVAARRGDHDAFAALIRAHAPRLRRLAETVAGANTADDILQDSIVAAWQAMPSFRGEARFGTWLHTICHRQAIRATRHAPSTVSLRDAIVRSERDWSDPHWTVDPAEVAVRASERQQLRSALGRLPIRYRTALIPSTTSKDCQPRTWRSSPPSPLGPRRPGSGEPAWRSWRNWLDAKPSAMRRRPLHEVYRGPAVGVGLHRRRT